jgi:predicted XRE-type DNA-binding protein
MTENDETYEGVWEAIEDTPEATANLRIRSELMVAITEQIRLAGITQAGAAKRFGVTQPRISDLMRGRIDLFSIDALVNMLTAAGLHLELHVSQVA